MVLAAGMAVQVVSKCQLNAAQKASKSTGKLVPVMLHISSCNVGNNSRNYVNSSCFVNFTLINRGFPHAPPPLLKRNAN